MLTDLYMSSENENTKNAFNLPGGHHDMIERHQESRQESRGLSSSHGSRTYKHVAMAELFSKGKYSFIKLE